MRRVRLVSELSSQMSKCAVCGKKETPGDYSALWVYMGKRAYCAEHVPSRKTLRRKVRELRATSRTSAKVTLGNATSADSKLPKVGRRSSTLPKGKAAGDLGIPTKATLRLELVLCGKGSCKKLHGPYWYAYWKERERTRKRYVGKHLPHALASVRERAMKNRPRYLRADHDARVLEELELGGDE